MRCYLASLLMVGCAVGQAADPDQPPGGPDAAVGGFADARPLADARPPADAAPVPDAWLPIDAVPPPDAPPPITEASIYACSYAQLYRFEAGPAWLIPVGTFTWPPPIVVDSVLDVAIDSDGVL